MLGPSVSKSFLKDLKLMDPKLGVKFNGEHFVVVYERPVGEPANVYRVKAEDGGFRQPDSRDLIALRKGDLAAEDIQSRLRKLSYMSEAMREKAKKDAADNIRHMTLDNKRQLANAAVRLTNQGKGNAAFRRVPTKRKGRTYEELKSGINA